MKRAPPQYFATGLVTLTWSASARSDHEHGTLVPTKVGVVLRLCAHEMLALAVLTPLNLHHCGDGFVSLVLHLTRQARARRQEGAERSMVSKQTLELAPGHRALGGSSLAQGPDVRDLAGLGKPIQLSAARLNEHLGHTTDSGRKLLTDLLKWRESVLDDGAHAHRCVAAL